MSTSPDLGPIEDVLRYYLKKLGAKHRENLRATVESLESTPESHVSMHLHANASIQNRRNEVFRIANVLVQESQAEVCRIANVWTRTERSSSLGHVKFRQIKEPVVEFLHVLSMGRERRRERERERRRERGEKVEERGEGEGERERG